MLVEMASQVSQKFLQETPEQRQKAAAALQEVQSSLQKLLQSAAPSDPAVAANLKTNQNTVDLEPLLEKYSELLASRVLEKLKKN